MSRWTFAVAFEPASRVPLAVQIERAIGAAIRAGRLRPNDPLPSSRSLAADAGVTRNTVVAAYQELAAQGWITATPGGKTRVNVRLPLPGAPSGNGMDPAFAAELPPSARSDLRSRWPLGAGEPDLRLVPVEPLARAMRRALRHGGGALLGYRDPRGVPAWLDAMGAWLTATRGIAAGREQLLSTRGAQHALDLVARALIRPGDRVAIEALGYAPAWRVFDLAGARRVPLAVDAEGVRIDALEAALEEGPIRAVYVTPHHQYPTTVPLSAPRRVALLRLAAQHRFAIIEDDYDHEFHYEGRPVLPLAAADTEGSVVYIGTFSKILAPGLRLGLVHGPAAFIAAVAEIRMASDRQGDGVLEAAIAELVAEGELQRHARRMRETYRARRDVLAEALQRRLAGALSFEVPLGGIGLWARVADGIDDEQWVSNARERGVGLRAGREFSATGERVPGLRLVFSRLDPEELRAAVDALALACPGP